MLERKPWKRPRKGRKIPREKTDRDQTEPLLLSPLSTLLYDNDKKKFIFIDGKALSESPNFPWYDSKLTERSKVGVVTSEMVRYSRRTDTKNDFIAHTMALIKKMVKFGYEKRKVMRKVQSFRQHLKYIKKF